MGADREDLNREGAKIAKPDHRLESNLGLATSAS
jgi:hypothetical protein